MRRNNRYTNRSFNTGQAIESSALTWAKHFGSWTDYVDFAVASEPTTDVRQSRNHYDYDGSWALGADWSECVALASNGWPQASQQVAEISQDIITRSEASLTHPEIFMDVTGSDFDIATMLSGAPEYWNRLEHTAEQKVIKLVFNACTSGGVRADIMKTKGAVVAALVQSLELCEVRVQVVLAFNSDNHLVTVNLKDASQPLDIDRLTFALAHPAAFRRLGFAVLETNYDFMSKHDSSYGRVMEVPDDLQGDIYIAGSHLYDPSYADPAVASAWVVEQLRGQGITISE